MSEILVIVYISTTVVNKMEFIVHCTPRMTGNVK